MSADTPSRQEHAVPTRKINYRIRRPLIPNRSLSPMTARVLGSKGVCHRGLLARKFGYARALGYHTLRRLTLLTRDVGTRKPFYGPCCVAAISEAGWCESTQRRPTSHRVGDRVGFPRRVGATVIQLARTRADCASAVTLEDEFRVLEARPRMLPRILSILSRHACLVLAPHPHR
jgi:hypothetical protein